MRQEGQAFVFPISQSLAEGHPLRGRAGSVSCVVSGPESQKLGDGSSTLKKGFGRSTTVFTRPPWKSAMFISI